MLKKGLGEGSTFAGCHPVVNLIFFGFAIGITMFSMNPWFLGVTVMFSWIYSILLLGKQAIKKNLIMTLPVIVVMALVNGIFINNGATVLFYLNDSRITLEALLYGVASAFLISAIILWFSCFNVIMSSDKLIYVFGKAAPVLGLTLSMIFRFIPLLKERFKEISMGQKSMGRHSLGGYFPKLRQVGKEVSILVSWSLEAAIETSDSMEARGYGLKGRTSFHLFKFSPRDKWLLLTESLLAVLATIGCLLGRNNIYYYPEIVMKEFDAIGWISLLAYGTLLGTPILLDLLGERKWQRYRLEN